MSFNLDVRPEVAAFALAMERKLRANDHKGGWGDEDRDWLIGRIKDETKELEEIVNLHESPTVEQSHDVLFWRNVEQRVLDEAVDVANFALMVADRCDALHSPMEITVMSAAETELAELHAELDKHRAPPAATAHERLRALMVDRLRAADAVLDRAREAVVTARAEGRRRLPDERDSVVHKFVVGGQEGYLIVGLYEDRTAGEMFLRMSTGRELPPQDVAALIRGLSDCFSIAVSLALQYGAPLALLVSQFARTNFEPAGATGNPKLPRASSLADYWFRWMAMKLLPAPEGDTP
jgi:hypothetical protein